MATLEYTPGTRCQLLSDLHILGYVCGARGWATLIAYAVRQNYELEFSPEGKITNIDSFSTDIEFYQEAVEFNSAMDYSSISRSEDAEAQQDCRMRDLYVTLRAIQADEYKRIYPNLIISLDSLVDGFAYSEVEKKLSAAIQETGVKSILDLGGSYSLLGTVGRDVSYSALVEIRNINDRFRFRIAQDIYKRHDAVMIETEDDFMNSKSFLTRAEGNKTGFDAVVLKFRYQSKLGGDAVERVVERLMEIASTMIECRYAFLITDMRVPMISALSGHHLSKVMSIDEDPVKCILVFDMKESRDAVLFPGNEMVKYAEIRKHGFWLVPALYARPKEQEGFDVVPLSTVALLIKTRIIDYYHSLKTDKKLPTYHLSASFSEVASPYCQPVMEESPGGVYEGQNLHLASAGNYMRPKIFAAISRMEGRYRCESDMVLKPNPKAISIEYLAYILMNDPRFRFLFNLVPSKYLQDYSIAVVRDLNKQKEIVSEELVRLRDVINSSGVYNVSLLNGGGVFSSEDIDQMREWNLTIQSNMSSVYGQSGLKELLPFAMKEGAKVDAILIDPCTDAKGTRLKGLQATFAFGRKHKVPVFVYSSMPLDEVKADLEEEDLNYCEDGHLFSAEGEFALKEFITAVRDELDKNGTLGSQLRVRYKREFASADTVEAVFGGGAGKTLEGALTNPNKSLNEVRKSMDEYLVKVAEKISSGSGVERADCGFLARLYKDTVAEDKNENRKAIYVLSDRLMGKTLGTALVFLYQITDGGSHGNTGETKNKLNVDAYIEQSGTTNIAMTVIHIYMEFLTWLAGTEGQFDVKCEYRDPSGAEISCPGIVHRASSDEYYAETEKYEKIHLGMRQGVRLNEGMKIFIKSIRPEAGPDHIRKYGWFTQDYNKL